MKKEEKIQESYREYWDVMKDHVDENGWFAKDAFSQINLSYEDVSSTIDFVHDHSTDEMIPKEIYGIKDNKNWIKIDSEEDLPQDSSAYWVWRSDERVSSINDYNTDRSYFFPHLKATHYQPIVKPEKPVY